VTTFFIPGSNNIVINTTTQKKITKSVQDLNCNFYGFGLIWGGFFLVFVLHSDVDTDKL
jgi:hypothetical protein